MQLHIVDHPLIRHKLALLRDETCPRSAFYTLLHEIGLLMAYVVTQDLETEETAIRGHPSPMPARKSLCGSRCL